MQVLFLVKLLGSSCYIICCVTFMRNHSKRVIYLHDQRHSFFNFVQNDFNERRWL